MIKIRGFAASVALSGLLLIAGCSSQPSEMNQVEEAPKPKPLSQIDPQAFKADPSTAMKEVPEAHRQDVQRAIVCHVNRQRQEGQVSALDAETIRKITESIKSGATVENACLI